MALSEEEIRELRVAKELLESPSLTAKIGSLLGTPIEIAFDKLPKNWSVAVNVATKKSIEKALDVAIWTMDQSEQMPPSNWWHKLAVGTTGAAGGFFGLPALAIELLRPVFHYIEFNFPFNFQRISHFTLPGNFLVVSRSS